MKKIVPLIILMLAFCSCSQDIQFNNEAVFQGIINNVFWKGGNAKAGVTSNGKMTIEAVSLTEVMKLQIPEPPKSINPKNSNTFVTYPLGTSAARTAYYSVTTAEGITEYKTAIGDGDGQVVISEYDGVTVSGTFRFNAKDVDPDSEAIVNVQSGTFYKVPVYPSI